jgi:hypothetical protein
VRYLEVAPDLAGLPEALESCGGHEKLVVLRPAPLGPQAVQLATDPGSPHLEACLRAFEQLPFVAAFAFDEVLSGACSHVALACDYLVAGRRARLRLLSGLRVPDALKGRQHVDRDQLDDMNLCEAVDSTAVEAALLEDIERAARDATAASIRLLRSAVRALDGGQDLARVVASLAAAGRLR